MVLINFLGLEQVKTLLQQELAYQRFRLLEAGIQQAMQEATEVDWEIEFEQAREAAFRAYQQQKAIIS
jgi:hypothetical protein